MSGKKYIATFEVTDEEIVLDVIEEGQPLLGERVYFNIKELKEKYRGDLDEVTIRDGLVVENVGVDDLRAFINLRVTFHKSGKVTEEGF